VTTVVQLCVGCWCNRCAPCRG